MSTVTVFHIQLAAQSVRMMRRVAERVLTEMQDAARVNTIGGQYSKGRLASSIYKTGPLVIGTTVQGSVGSRLSYAKIVESGAKIHDIFPKRAPHIYRFGTRRRPMLRFAWNGRIVYMNQIPGGPGTIGRSHPGVKGKHWLAHAITSVAMRNGLRVVIYEI